MKINLSELEAMAKAVKYHHNWDKSDFYELGMDVDAYVGAMSPTTALALISVARAARDYYFAPYCDDHECGCHEAHHEELKEALEEIEA